MKNKSFSWAQLLAVGIRMILLVFLLAAVLIYSLHVSRVVVHNYSLDYGEGPLLNQAVRLAAGENIYPTDIATPPYTITNYPPLYVLAQAPFIAIFGPSLLAGRLLSAVSTLFTAVFLALIIRHFAKYHDVSDRLLPWLTAATFLAFPFVVSWSGLLRIDMFALALSTAALYVLVRWSGQRKGLIIGGLLLVGAIYTRQSYALAAPLAAFSWLWFGSSETAVSSTTDRRQVFTLAALVGGASLGLFLILNLLTGGGFFFHIVTANVNEFRLTQLWEQLGRLVTTAPVLLLLAVIAIIWAWRKRPYGWSLVIPYLIGGFLSMLTIGKIGSNVNYFLELAAALSLLAWIMLLWIRPYPWLNVIFLAALSLQVGLLLQNSLDRPVRRVSFRLQDEIALNTLREVVADTEGDILADEQMALLTLQERPLYIQPFEVTQLAKAGIWDQSPVLEGIQNQDYPLILVYYPSFSNETHVERWTPEMLAAIEEWYLPSQTLAGNVLYTPSQNTTITTNAPVENPPFTPQVSVAEMQIINQVPYVFEPRIAINTQNPNHLAAIIASSSARTCVEDCQGSLLLYTSTDSGQTWKEQVPFSGEQPMLFGNLIFTPNGQLYTVGLRGAQVVINQTDTADYVLSPSDTQAIRTGFADVPQLVYQPETERLYLAYSGRLRENMGASLKQSSDQGDTWSFTVQAGNGVSINEIESGQATVPQFVHVLLGQDEELAMVWGWKTGFFDWPLGVWVATSEDGGQNFTEPQQIADTWGPVSAAFHNGRYYVLYRGGVEATQRLVLATSDDQGQTWQKSVASGDIPLTYDLGRGAGIDIAPNGMIDIIFYAHQDHSAVCVIDPETWRNSLIEGEVDHCTYDVYYTYSQDNGQTFSQPLQLNEVAIEGEGFVQFYGRSVMGIQPDMASANEYAYPIWIQAQSDSAIQAVTVQITRDTP